jgi:DNA-binding NarL/FixJ family response regulator
MHYGQKPFVLPSMNPLLKNRLLNILIVDDNRRFVNRLLGLIRESGRIGYIQIAENYDEACRLLADEQPDVAMLDINLPGKNGLAVLKKIKQECPGCEVIMITNHSDEYYRQQCRDLGAAHFLDKTHEFVRVPGILDNMNRG